MVKQLIVSIKARLDAHREYQMYEHGVVKLIPAVDLPINAYCYTRYGVGRVVEPATDLRDTVVVEIHKQRRQVNPHKVMRFVVYHDELGDFIPISPSDYNHVAFAGQAIEYRITRGGYAQLTARCRNQYEGYAILQRRKNGRQLLQNLLRHGWQVNR